MIDIDLAMWLVMIGVVFFICPYLRRIAVALERIAAALAPPAGREG
jgi:hypothetical protein